MTGVNLIATLRPAPGKTAELRQILCETAHNVKQVEQTCFTFLLTECKRPDGTIEFKVIERWANKEALEVHHERSWLQSMYSTFDEKQLLDGPEQIEELTVISGFAAR
ncbi:hypothetical protein BO70DRAFT_359226 [Aspergillus heteromorphus CBS 117.55]|uniref:ABM domain-containing protein n=1 Tax=Aspergillus heteromorphus CBS 117.55 TaxID=1448321 RepID=A0A317WUZ1_9EURO|nr:uncharacterized protein BO70DRAFT_359226 [Aspergillus heteromorphus CBS 117.55]PWY90244.1 hypothetical protein BO70DRAFT_359226 [Aspergillus heteromorphus CBS 117.55]